jgi:hypothetical protein
MISQALGRLRVRTTDTEQLDDLLSESDTPPRRPSTNPLDTSAPSPMNNVTASVLPAHAPKITKREQKRYGNNLFGSGTLREDDHPRIVRGVGRSASLNAGSDTSTISRTLRTKFKLLRPGSPEADPPDTPAPASPNLLTDHESFPTSQTAFLEPSPNVSTETLEEEAQEARVDDDVVLLRSPVVDQPQVTVDIGNYLVSRVHNR